MAYNELTRESGGDEKSRLAEAGRIVKMLDEYMESATYYHNELKPHEVKFVTDMKSAAECTTKQLFWLRDLKAKDIE